MSSFLLQAIGQGPYLGYSYSYPHKTAYRPLSPPVPLDQAWSAEDKTRLFLYAHVPFCEMRCGFCNLFTTANPGTDRVEAWLQGLERQTEAVAGALGPEVAFSRFAMGGGTPTHLDLEDLERALGGLARCFPALEPPIPRAIEASPATLTPEKAAFLRNHRFTRVSLGVQSFLEDEVRALGRTQSAAEVRRALALLCKTGFPCVNVDLIYGIPGQSPAAWRRSLEEALEFRPQEIYLYPLYVRPLTGLGRLGREPEDNRLDLYRVGRDFLRERGYRQVSMRFFRAANWEIPEGPVYCCQEDGMVGLGPGARSYTAALHYSTDYAVGRQGVLEILRAFEAKTREQFSLADYGIRLDVGEQRRRYALKSLLRAEGLDLAAYRTHFGSDPFTDLPELAELEAADLAGRPAGCLRLNDRGLELSDAIAPWLCSPEIRRRMESFTLA